MTQSCCMACCSTGRTSLKETVIWIKTGPYAFTSPWRKRKRSCAEAAKWRREHFKSWSHHHRGLLCLCGQNPRSAPNRARGPQPRRFKLQIFYFLMTLRHRACILFTCVVSSNTGGQKWRRPHMCKVPWQERKAIPLSCQTAGTSGAQAGEEGQAPASSQA